MAAKAHDHGTRGRYRAGCRCSTCRRWKADDTAAYRARKNGGAPAADVEASPKKKRRRARPTGGESEQKRPTTLRRPSSDDDLAQLIEAALWDARGDEGTASVLAAEAIREAGYRQVIDGPIEAAVRAAFVEPVEVSKAWSRETALRAARSLDDPENARYTKSIWETLRQSIADLSSGEGADDAAAIMDAIRSASRD